MPPKKAGYDGPPNIPMSLRFKYGIHTFFILVEPSDPFSAISKELIEALHDRAEPILATNTELVLKMNPKTNLPELDPISGEPVEEWVPADPIPVPSKDDDLQIDYAVRKDIHDPSKGWKNLNIQPDDTPISRGLKNNAELAFVVRKTEEATEPAEPAEFQVKPTIWEGEAEEDEQQGAPSPKGGAAKGKGKGKQKVVSSIEDADVYMDEDEEL